MKKILNFFFIYMILEGVLRKWLFSSLSTEIYFIKDFFLIIIYLLALKQNLIFNLKYSKLFIAIILFISLFGFIGYEFSKNGIISYFLGLRSYWLFLPLFLIIINVYNKDDLIKFIKINLYFVLPYFILILLQAKLPESSIFNSGYTGMIQNPERPSGYFTYTTQNTYYFLFLFLCFGSFVLNKKEIFTKDIIILSILNFLLFALMILLKSRAVYVYVFVTIFYSTLFLLLSKFESIIKIKKIFIILVVSLISFNVLSSKILEEEYKYSSVRINTDTYYQMGVVTDNEDTSIPFVEESVYEYCTKYSSFCRILNELYFLPALKTASFFGEGIGSGTRSNVLYNKLRYFELGEIENLRIVMELGSVIGPIFVISKIIIVTILNFYALIKFRDNNRIMYIPILIFISVQILIGPITYTTSFINFVFWFTLGLLFTSFVKKHKN